MPNPDFLETSPESCWLSGIAEVQKKAKKFFDFFFKPHKRFDKLLFFSLSTIFLAARNNNEIEQRGYSRP